jgi:hypothetical protein
MSKFEKIRKKVKKFFIVMQEKNFRLRVSESDFEINTAIT